MKLFSKEISINPDLTLESLEKHANGKLRYQNVTDLIKHGSTAIEIFTDRVNDLFQRKLTRSFNTSAYACRKASLVELSYKTVFFQGDKEEEHEAMPMTDFIGFNFQDGNVEKHGYGIMFSFYGREYDRNKLESKNEKLGSIDLSAEIYHAMYTDRNPEFGVLNDAPIIVMVGIKDPTTHAQDKLDEYYAQLGMTGCIVYPKTGSANFRVFCHKDIRDLDQTVLAAALATGQTMQEVIRPHIYTPPDTKNFPSFDWAYQKTVTAKQSQLAKDWIGSHIDEIQKVIQSNRFRRNDAEKQSYEILQI